MKTTILTMWYNEAFLAPFFLSHYAYADKIHILLDADTDDNTREICSRYGNVVVEDFTFPDMMDDEIKADKISAVARRSDADWLMAVDADEFIFPMGGEDPIAVLSRQTANLMYARMWQVYKYRAEDRLDPDKPAIFQRRHGDPNTSVGDNALYRKPIIVKPKVGIEWYVGCHEYAENANIVVSDEYFIGAHWAMADVEMAVRRYLLGRLNRQSENNLAKRFTIRPDRSTETQIRRECRRHDGDPLLF